MKRQREEQALGRLLDIMDRLRAECPWDREQTFESLRSNTIEETYELAEAITSGNMDSIREELGDLLLHVVFYSKLGEEQSAFGFADVADAICDKLIYRHPHVFGDIHADTPDEVLRNWELLKLRKKNRRKGVLSGVPRALPAMVKALRIGEKAAGAGFDWSDRSDVWAKVAEEQREVAEELASLGAAESAAGAEAADTAQARSRLEGEMGDLFFALINACRLYGIDPEQALERTNLKFIKRFEHIEDRAEELGKNLRDMTLDEMESYWQEAKKL